ncbi:Membrane associated serine protease, rhomboid family [Evansella caseinilytica]|uniref:Membrane associated serine protease, rhomboid family n=1 Tax=Evansella caseinilytica TaxID=1503961 RepID=A0A1H3QI63_9BACI|nr:rhomboid family intramembrane serine protease [Evansella caseinilytica]SDZ13096.1 Membrane associated serine protease, rhomboid family [Evansella caseinilytica]
MFLRTESFSEFIRYYKVVTTLVAIHIILYIWMDYFPLLGGRNIYLFGVGSNLNITMGEYWRLLTPIFLHGSLMHMLFNSFSLILFGPALEQMLGKTRFIAAYLGAGVLANIATYFVGSPTLLHLGASGAIYGLFGIYLYIVLFRPQLMDRGNSQLILTILIIGVVMTFLNPRGNINILGHVFGLIAGAAIAPLVLFKVNPYSRYNRAANSNEISFDPYRWQKKAKNKKRIQTIAIAVGALLLLLFLIQFLL